jgi:putative transposase
MASTYLSLYTHIIFATHGRAPTIARDWRQDLHNYLGGAVRELGAKPMIVGGVADHVHILASLSATHPIADLVREVKKSSSIWAKCRYESFSWQQGYAAFSLGADRVRAVSQYIADQEDHHKAFSSAEELRALLDEHGVAFDERFFE